MQASIYDHTEQVDLVNYSPAGNGIGQGTPTAQSNGIAIGAYGPCPEGFCWYFERLSTYSNTSGTPILEVYVVTAPNPAASTTGLRSRRLDYTPQGKNDLMDEVNPIYVQPGYWLLAVWSTLTSGDLCTLSCQLRVHQLTRFDAAPIINFETFEKQVSDYDLQIHAGYLPPADGAQQ
jgi:hypothetical protein